jgi:hypothetical protein
VWGRLSERMSAVAELGQIQLGKAPSTSQQGALSALEGSE